MTQRLSLADYKTLRGTSSTNRQGRIVAVEPLNPEDPKPSKYRNKKCEHNGIKFDSKHERKCWIDLEHLQANGAISHLQRQVPYTIEVNGEEICRYVADFLYCDDGGALVVADAKGVRTADYRLKKKLMKAVLGIDIVEM